MWVYSQGVTAQRQWTDCSRAEFSRASTFVPGSLHVAERSVRQGVWAKRRPERGNCLWAGTESCKDGVARVESRANRGFSSESMNFGAAQGNT